MAQNTFNKIRRHFKMLPLFNASLSVEASSHITCVAGLENIEERINRQEKEERLDIFQFINDLKDNQENIAF